MANRGKPRLALFGFGILGGGKSGQGIPVLTDLFRRLSGDFEIVYYCFTRIFPKNVSPGIEVRQILPWPIPIRIKYAMLMAAFSLDHLIRPYDLLFSVSVQPTGRVAVILGKIFRRPVVVQLIALEAVSLNDIGYGNLSKPGLRRITKWVCDGTDVLVTVAKYQMELARASLPTSRDIKVLPLRIDPAKFPYHERTIGFPVEFIHIGYYSPVKDQDTLFATFGKVAEQIDCGLTVVGDGFNTPKVRAMLIELKILDKVNFTGEVRQSELPKYFRKAHILLHTSVFETGCAVIQEAMASGVAVCGTDVGILADIGERYAAVARPRDVDHLVQKILQLIRDPQSYLQKRTEAYHWIKSYDADWAYRNYRELLFKLIPGI